MDKKRNNSSPARWGGPVRGVNNALNLHSPG